MTYISYHFIFYRAITKILGDWWASLSEEEKKCYTNLAKQVSLCSI